MKIIYFEGGDSSLFKLDYMREVLRHEVWQTHNFRKLLSWLDHDPTHKYFDALMFDFNAKSYEKTLPVLKADEPYSRQKHYSPTLYFIDNYINKYCKHFYDDRRIVICSAFFDKIHTLLTSEQFAPFRLIDKSSLTLVEDIKRTFEEMGTLNV
ncbi:MAG: hypothetical protein FWD90_06520 [Defluviitaleaceae bacterium]|nr:hypothetical protein [Defluviitaleaceae bacterium]